MLLMPPSCTHAVANTPAETTGACVARFPVAGSLPRISGGSASALVFSRPARTFTHVTACALAEPSKTVLWHRSASIHVVTSMNRSDCFRLERPLAGQDSHLLGGTAFPRRTITGTYQRIRCLRGDAENRLKEVKAGLGLDRTSCHRFLAN